MCPVDWPTVAGLRITPLKQAVHLRESWEVTQQQHAEGDTSASGGERKGELAMISHKFSFPPQRLQKRSKREHCHWKEEMCQLFVSNPHPGQTEPTRSKGFQGQNITISHKGEISLDLVIWILDYKQSWMIYNIPWMLLQLQSWCILFTQSSEIIHWSPQKEWMILFISGEGSNHNIPNFISIVVSEQ